MFGLKVPQQALHHSQIQAKAAGSQTYSDGLALPFVGSAVPHIRPGGCISLAGFGGAWDEVAGIVIR